MLHISNLIKSGIIDYKRFRRQWESLYVSFVVSQKTADERTIDRLVIWDTMMLMWLHCNDNALYGYSHKISNNLFQMISSPMGEFAVSFAVRQDMLLCKPSSCQRFETP